MINNTLISKDVVNKTIHITREFSAPVEKVWKAWTESNLLNKWWAPKPWKAETKSMNFKEGGLWLYCMVGPENARHWSRVDFKTLQPGQGFTAITNFCDEQGNVNTGMPAMYWQTAFYATEAGSKIEVEISFDKEADMQTIIEMGFEAGFTMALGNLDELMQI